MTRRAFFQFFTKHISKIGAGGAGAGAMMLLNYKADEAKGSIADHEKRIRELEAYNSSLVAQVQILLARTKLS